VGDINYELSYPETEKENIIQKIPDEIERYR